LIIALTGHLDARGFRQWQQAGRTVRKGEKALYILGPVMRRVRQDDPDQPEADTADEPRRVLRGFRAIPVFGARQTEGDPLSYEEDEASFVSELPLIDVARAWDIEVSTFHGCGSSRLGFFRYSRDDTYPQSIGLGTRNLPTWAHELVHAAEKRRGTLAVGTGPNLADEVVAEFGGTVLLECLGKTVDSDRGGAYEYIAGFAEEHERNVLALVTELVDRACAAVALILDAAAEIAASSEACEA
jgi:antirestriction protein ArdC